jgi:cytochrome-b5 reductase
MYEANMCKYIGMIAGGTGITPMLQIVNAVLKNPNDVTRVSLIFANVAESDILCRKELDKLADDPRFSVYYVLNNVRGITNSRRNRKGLRGVLGLLHRK